MHLRPMFFNFLQRTFEYWPDTSKKVWTRIFVLAKGTLTLRELNGCIGMIAGSMDVSDDPKLKVVEAESLKRVAFFGIAVSTVATLTAIIAVPMVYNYMQHVQSSLQIEIDFCKHRTNGLWEQYSVVCAFRLTYLLLLEYKIQNIENISLAS